MDVPLPFWLSKVAVNVLKFIGDWTGLLIMIDLNKNKHAISCNGLKLDNIEELFPGSVITF